MSKTDDDMTGGVAIALLVILLIAFGADLAWNAHVYGDWTCAFSRCVRVRP